MRHAAALGALLLFGCAPSVSASQTGLAAPLAVEFVNASRATRCMEEDNVYVKVVAKDIASFGITAEHPPYVTTISKDSTAPDFTACDFSGDPSFRFKPRKVVLYENAR